MKGRAILLFVLSALLTSSSSAGANSKEVLEHPRFRFCHENRYPLYESERRWCPLVGKSNEVCPALPLACEAKVKPRRRSDSIFPGGGGSGRKAAKRGKPAEGDARSHARRRFSLKLPDGLSVFAEALFYLLIAAAVGTLIWIVARNLRNKDEGEQDQSVTEEQGKEESEEEQNIRKRAVETDVDRLLDRARAAAANGKFDAAIDDAYAALLRRLDGDGLIDMHNSRTNGDYVRNLRHQPQLSRAVADVIRDVERVQFGRSAANASLFDVVLARILPLVGRASTFLFMLATVFGLSACEVIEETDADDSPYAMSRGSSSPLGTKAILELLKKQGLEADYQGTAATEVSEAVDVLILWPGSEPREESSKDGWKMLLEWVADGHRLILAGTSMPPALELKAEPSTDSSSQLQAGPFYASEFDGATFSVISDSALKLREFHTEEELLFGRGGEVYASYQSWGAGEVIAFADAALFSNVAMTVADNERLLLWAVQSGHTTVRDDPLIVELNVPWSGGGAANPITAIDRANLTPIILQLLLLVILFLLYKGVAFGRFRDPQNATRRSFADHVRALGLQYSRAQAQAHAFGHYASWVLEKLRERSPREARRGLRPLAQSIAARTHYDETEVVRVLTLAQSASDLSEPPSFRPASLRGTQFDTNTAPKPDYLSLMRQLDSFLAVTGRSNSPEKTEPQ